LPPAVAQDSGLSCARVRVSSTARAMATPLPAYAHAIPGGLELRLKVVPGGSRDALAGILGDRLKIKVAAPPEGGKANAAVERLLSDLLGAPVRITAGHGAPLKTAQTTATAECLARLG